jgi:hypothetical protein
MLIRARKQFAIGAVMLVGFAAVLAFMFTPSFGGQNAFHASDQLFNSIAKGSTYYIPEVLVGVAQYDGQEFAVTVFREDHALGEQAATILRANGIDSRVSDGGSMQLSGDLGVLMRAALADAAAMFANDGDALSSRYGIDGRRATFVWWKLLKETKADLDRQNKFAQATYLEEEVLKRGVEVGYNFYGIEGRKASEEWPLLSFALVFYVVYTLWFGYGIFFLFEGLGLRMIAGRKKEV